MQEEKQKTRPKFQPLQEDKKQQVNKNQEPKEEDKPKAKVCRSVESWQHIFIGSYLYLKAKEIILFKD